MKKLVFAIALVALAVSGSAFAQDEIWQNNMGVYFDAEGTVTMNNDGVPGLMHVYLVLSNLTSPTVDGFECKITSQGGLLVAYDSKTFPLDTIDVGTRYGEIIAGFGQPLPVADGKAVVMEFDIVVTDAAVPGELFIDPLYFPSVPGAPAYLFDGEVIPVHNSTAPGLPVLVTNGTEEPVATESTSFDNLKSLYR